jgi:hypothetical protein
MAPKPRPDHPGYPAKPNVQYEVLPDGTAPKPGPPKAVLLPVYRDPKNRRA